MGRKKISRRFDIVGNSIFDLLSDNPIYLSYLLEDSLDQYQSLKNCYFRLDRSIFSRILKLCKNINLDPVIVANDCHNEIINFILPLIQLKNFQHYPFILRLYQTKKKILKKLKYFYQLYFSDSDHLTSFITAMDEDKIFPKDKENIFLYVISTNFQFNSYAFLIEFFPKKIYLDLFVQKYSSELEDKDLLQAIKNY